MYKVSLSIIYCTWNRVQTIVQLLNTTVVRGGDHAGKPTNPRLLEDIPTVHLRSHALFACRST